MDVEYDAEIVFFYMEIFKVEKVLCDFACPDNSFSQNQILIKMSCSINLLRTSLQWGVMGFGWP